MKMNTGIVLSTDLITSYLIFTLPFLEILFVSEEERPAPTGKETRYTICETADIIEK